jgi:hypothetical protein
VNIKGKFSQINNVFRRKHGEQGSTLVIVLVMMATMVAIAIGAIKVTQLNVESSGAYRKGKQTFYAAEVGVDYAVNDIIKEFENLNIYTTTADNGGSPGKTINYRGYSVNYNITNPLDRFLYRTVVGNSTIFHYAYTFNIEADATSLSDTSKETVNETTRILETPLVQYFAFYAGAGDLADLELYPGGDMNIWGRMHANRDMYIVGRNNDVIIRNWDLGSNFSPHFVSMGGVFKGMQKHLNSYQPDTDTFVRINNNLTIIASPTTDAEFLEIPLDVNTGNEAAQEAAFNDYLGVNGKTHQAPSKEQFNRLGFYEGRADDPQDPRVDSMKIIGTGNGIQVWVSRPVLTEVTAEIINGGAAILHSDNSPMVSNPIEDSATTTGANTLYDGRETRWVDFTDIDLNLLHTWYLDYLIDEGLNWAGDGMLIYVSRSGTGTIPNPNNGARMEALRLRVRAGSSPTLLANTTLATDNPIYIQGDFNTINTKGVALVSDAQNILSNAFTTKGTLNVDGIYEASATTVNAAFFSGIKPNVLGVSPRVGGGLHNYARLHEDWQVGSTDILLNINGSFISLWQSTQATGDWCHGTSTQCYYRPGRNYGWDIRFQDPDFWPPFIPSIFSVERVGFLEAS